MHPDLPDFSRADPRAHWAARWREELTDNVLPWWQRQIFDAEGRVLGARGNDGQPREATRSAVLGTRLLWTFASAQHRLGATVEGGRAAHRAWAWLNEALIDPVDGGVFWSVDGDGRPLQVHKQTYAQAFAIYALCACHAWQAKDDSPALQQALDFFELLQAHAFDPADGGCWEGRMRDWRPLPSARLSDKEPAAPKTMNTMLHVLEALTELLGHHRVPAVEARLRELLVLFLDRIWLPGRACFGLYFSEDWRVLTPDVSWGHDIEAAWLLVRAADMLADAALQARTRALAVQVADAVLARGVAPDGSVLGEGRFDGSVTDERRHWWCQAEAVVGFWDAWQWGGDPRHAETAWRAWAYIDRHHVDRVGGDWFKTLDPQGRPLDSVPKAGPWECPYHHVRAGLEMIERLALAQ
jgi:mannobiose 2-epimerase